MKNDVTNVQYYNDWSVHIASVDIHISFWAIWATFNYFTLCQQRVISMLCILTMFYLTITFGRIRFAWFVFTCFITWTLSSAICWRDHFSAPYRDPIATWVRTRSPSIPFSEFAVHDLSYQATTWLNKVSRTKRSSTWRPRFYRSGTITEDKLILNSFKQVKLVNGSIFNVVVVCVCVSVCACVCVCVCACVRVRVCVRVRYMALIFSNLTTGNCRIHVFMFSYSCRYKLLQ
jgi:hypothetical protein